MTVQKSWVDDGTGALTLGGFQVLFDISDDGAGEDAAYEAIFEEAHRIHAGDLDEEILF